MWQVNFLLFENISRATMRTHDKDQAACPLKYSGKCLNLGR